MSTESTESAGFDRSAITNTLAGIAIITGTPLRVVQEAATSALEFGEKEFVAAERDGVTYFTPNGVEMIHHNIAWSRTNGHVILWQMNNPAEGLVISRAFGDQLAGSGDVGEWGFVGDAAAWMRDEWDPVHDDRCPRPSGVSDVPDLPLVARPVARWSALRGLEVFVPPSEMSAAAREYLDL
jgi:hypothetical protein